MEKLKTIILTLVVLTSVFASVQFAKPVDAATIGTHQIKVNFYQAYIYNDHDFIGAGEWYFYLQSAASTWSGTVEIVRDGPGYCYFSLWKSWSIAGGVSTWWETWAREKDLVWDSGADSKVHWTLTWPSTVTPPYYKRSASYQYKDVTHYITYYIYNRSPATGNISGPSWGNRGIAYTFTAKNFYDPDVDSITYQWYVDGVLQSATGSSLTYTFPTGAKLGSHTIKARAKDALNAYSSYASKTFTLCTSFQYPVGSADSLTWGISQQYAAYGLVYPSKYHTGVDLNLPGWEDYGKPVAATGEGTVVVSTYASGWGNVIVIKHISPVGTVYSLYGHLKSRSIAAGVVVAKGQLIGYVGNTGSSSGPHLHFEIKSQACVNQLGYLGPGYTPKHPSTYGYYNPLTFVNKY